MLTRRRRLSIGSMGGMWMVGILWFSLQNMDQMLSVYIKAEFWKQFQRQEEGQEVVVLGLDIETVTEIERIGGAAAVEAKVGMRMTGITTMRKIIAAEAEAEAAV